VDVRFFVYLPLKQEGFQDLKFLAKAGEFTRRDKENTSGKSNDLPQCYSLNREN